MPQYSGVWSLQQQMQALTSGQWVTDPLFDYTTLLLQGDAGANGAQNNVFYDTSPNQFAITRNGNTTQGTFSPFSATGWSNFFDGTGDYLTISDSASLELGSSDFCLECFVNFSVLPPSNGNTATFLSKWAASPNASYLYYLYNDNGTQKLYFTYTTNGTTPVNVGGIAWAPSVGVWYHVAVTRSGSNLRFFVNGVQAGATQTLSATVSDTTANTAVGGFQTTGDMNGYISNARIVIGSPVYTADFAPSTSPLTAITNTRLLTCQNNRFVDNSTNAFSIVVNGNTSVQAFSPFAPQFQYTASGTGGSGYFDGGSDYLTITGSGSAFTFGTGDFTIEAFVYPTTTGSGSQFVYWQYGSSVDAIGIYYDASTKAVKVDLRATNLSSTTVTASNTIFPSAWNHIALVRSGGTNIYLYLNGVRTSATIASNASFNEGQAGFFTQPQIGAQSNPIGNYCTGHISNFRTVKGTAVYTGTTLTVPTAPLTAISNTQFLASFTNAGILDGTMKNNLETVNNAQISTSVVKYGSGSMYFDGTGDYLTVPASQQLAFNTGDFTVECWVYLAAFAASSEQGILQISTTSGGFSTSATNSTAIAAWNSSGQGFRIYANNGATASGIIPSTNQWYHLAVVRQNGVTKLYVNGSLSATVSSDTTNYTGTYLVVGGYYSTSYLLNGYIDDLRITKGIARYTQNFIPPSVALPRQ